MRKSILGHKNHKNQINKLNIYYNLKALLMVCKKNYIWYEINFKKGK